MAIHTEQVSEIAGGFTKEIEAGAMSMIYDNLQKSQYQYPIKSTVREIVSNALDSIREKNVAKSILLGLSKVEDHYIEREGEVYKDSRFNPDYYNYGFLSENNDVTIIYKDGGDVGKDMIIVSDEGVGLGGDRMRGYFNLGFSTKRLNKFALGKFGLGAKSPLSTLAPFYTVVSRWNGKEFAFNIYLHKIEPIVPKFDLDTRTENKEYVFSINYKCYYRDTTLPNGVTVSLQVKKHHKQQYIDAVTSQLLYFPNVKFYIEDEREYRTEVPVQADIMYEDDMIVLSNNSPYSKPHLLLNGVNYGYINFEEMDLEQKMGNIGIKVPAELVSINPSREALIWDDVTREVVVNRFHEVVKIAEDTINKELNEGDFLRWIKVCASANASRRLFSSEDTVIGRLSRIVDMSKISLRFPGNRQMRFNAELFEGLNLDVVSVKKSRKGSATVMKVLYEHNYGWKHGIEMNSMPIILRSSGMNNRKNKYLGTETYPQGFILIKVDKKIDLTAGELVTPEDIPEKGYKQRLSLNDRDNVRRIGEECRFLADVQNYLQQSANVIWYEDVFVPEDFKATESEEEEVEDEKEEPVSEAAKISAAERRKQNGTTVLHTPRIEYSYNDADGKLYAMQKVELPMSAIDKWTNDEVFWSNQDTEVLLHTVSLITRPYNETNKCDHMPNEEYEDLKVRGYITGYQQQLSRCCNFRENSPVRLIKVAQDNVKYYQDFKHITKFFKEIRKKTITMSNALVRWNTARLIQEKIEQLQFLSGFETINPELYAQYNSLKSYMTANWRSLQFDAKVSGADPKTTGQLIAHLNKVGEFQLFVRNNPDDKEAIAELAKRMFNPNPGVEIEDGLAIDTPFYDLYMKLLDWASPVQVMMNMVGPLTDGENLTQEQEAEIRHYFSYRGVTI